MSVYVPGTQEKDLSKVIMSLQAMGAQADILATAGQGLINSGGSLAVSLSKITASLGADVALNNISNFFDGPSIAQGATGTWFVSGQVTCLDTAGAASMVAKLWDGTTVINSALATTSGAGARVVISLSGFISSPIGNIRISVQDGTATTGKIIFNASGLSKDSTITGIRIA